VRRIPGGPGAAVLPAAQNNKHLGKTLQNEAEGIGELVEIFEFASNRKAIGDIIFNTTYSIVHSIKEFIL
jgi:hypothetical protein